LTHAGSVKSLPALASLSPLYTGNGYHQNAERQHRVADFIAEMNEPILNRHFGVILKKF
jgi:hypothetical protein